jgi:large conductance mechanosensitive channel
MGLIKEFKEFIIKGNAIDLAVGIILGAAFGGVVSSLVADVLMPPIGALMGGVDFSEKKYELLAEIPAGSAHPVTQLTVAKTVPAVVVSYGKFINTMISLVIQGFAVFMIVKTINKLKKKKEDAPPPPPPADVQLLTEIRDLLKQRS